MTGARATVYLLGRVVLVIYSLCSFEKTRLDVERMAGICYPTYFQFKSPSTILLLHIDSFSSASLQHQIYSSPIPSTEILFTAPPSSHTPSPSSSPPNSNSAPAAYTCTLDRTALRTCHSGTHRLCRSRVLCVPCWGTWRRTSRLFVSGSGRWGLGRARSARRGWGSRSRSSGRGLLMAFSVGASCGECGLVCLNAN